MIPTNAGEDGEKLNPSSVTDVDGKLWKTVGQFLKNLTMQQTYNLAIALLGTFPREMENFNHTETCT